MWRRWAIVGGAVFLGALLLAWANAFTENPPVAFPASAPTALSVRVPAVVWSVSGCDVPSVTAAGGSFPAGGNATLVGHLVNKSPSVACTLTSLNVTPTTFPMLSSSLPVTLNASTSGEVSVTLQIPPFAPAVDLQVSLTGGA